MISAPQSLFDPAFGLGGIDFRVMHSELRGYTELVNRIARLPQAKVAGDVTRERAKRAAGAKRCPT